LLPDDGKVPNVVVAFAPGDVEVAAGFFAFVAPEDVLERWKWRLAGVLLRRDLARAEAMGMAVVVAVVMVRQRQRWQIP